MFALILSEGAGGGDLSWLLYLALALFVLIVIIGYLVSRKAEKEGEKAADDLTKIEGIGPKVAEVLKAEGITTYADLIEAGVEKVNAILDAAGYQMMDAGTWIEQAKLAAKGDWDALAKLQEELKGGRRTS
ncbi:MAG: hypothetical protein D6770_06435 [Anaerolineae bacterium]|nr:MAG: hypothetical protein D6770_06435 [Anaerolineae bacterium]